ncbi:hypothetical protein C8Q73DRAFT_789105 [Cubamyces lactineus]|nr:hypothetical protein C8Q73DRAFT_789105 [Cubamyces lactineus]
MGGYDEVCFLCGIRPEGGPFWWCSNKEEAARQITNELLEAQSTELPLEEILSMLLKIFDMDRLDLVGDYGSTVHFPFESGIIGIGHFGDDGGYRPCAHHGRPLHPTGDDVQIRRVCNSVGGGLFTYLIDFEGGKPVIIPQVTTNCDTLYYSDDSPSCNIWVHVACWNYAQDWLDCPLPPRTGRGGNPLTFAGELYELVGSRNERQVDARASLPCVDYGGTLDAYMDKNQWQDYILGCRKGVRHLARALGAGLRDEQLIPAILKDSNWWMFCRPDIWPRAPTPGLYDPNPMIKTSDVSSQPRAKICQLPSEILLELIQHFHLQDIFTLAYTCKDLYVRLLDHNTLILVIRNAMANVSSPLHWIIPVREFPEEWLAAHDAMKTWMPAGTPPSPTFAELEFSEDEDHDEDYIPSDEEESKGDDVEYESGESADEAMTDEDEGIVAGQITDVPVPVQPHPLAAPLPPLLLLDPAFPLLTFLRAYCGSESMRARQRRWERIKQFDVLFTNYRRDGWERDDFCLPGTTWVPDGQTLRCQCPEFTS